jgi:acyl-CoA dehydrogenase
MEAEYAGAFCLAFRSAELLGALEHGRGGDAEERLSRTLIPLAKLTTAKQAVALASEALEACGGAGYVEDTGLPRLLADAQVLPIWEGTTNVLALDMLRALTGGEGVKPLLVRIQTAIDAAADRLPVMAQALAHAAGRLAADAETAADDPTSARILAGARGLALRLGYALGSALLIEHAAWAIEQGDEAPATAATLWTLRWLAGADISHEAHQRLEQLLGW